MKKNNTPTSRHTTDSKLGAVTTAGATEAKFNNPNHVNEIVNFLDCSSGFNYSLQGTELCVTQSEDQLKMKFDFNHVEKILTRQDFDGTHFLQVNFLSGAKILVTKNLIGFKPTELPGFDSTKIPKVVTTVDLKSVKRAIEDTYEDETPESQVELEVLKKVFQSILTGAEQIGFDMSQEKNWFFRSMLNHTAASA